MPNASSSPELIHPSNPALIGNVTHSNANLHDLPRELAAVPSCLNECLSVVFLTNPGFVD